MKSRLFSSLVCLGASACHEGTFSLGIGPGDEDPQGVVAAGGSTSTGAGKGSGGIGSTSGGAAGSTSSAGGSGGTSGAGGTGNVAGTAGSAGSSGGSDATGGSAGAGGSAGTMGEVTAAKGILSLANLSSDGTQSNDMVLDYSMSADGRLVAFASLADNVVPFDTNGVYDVFLRDRETSTTIVASVNELGELGNSDSVKPALSRDGRRLLFYSWGTNLGAGSMLQSSVLYLSQPFDGLDTFVPGVTPMTSPSMTSIVSGTALSGRGDVAVYLWNTNNFVDVFAFNTAGAAHKRMSDCNGLSVDADGGHPTISADGKRVLFTGTAGGLQSVFAADFDTGECHVVSVGFDGSAADGPSGWPSVSDDGRFVAFGSAATNLIPGGDDDGGLDDIFVRDLVSQTTQRIDVGGAVESSCPALSGDGRRIAFVSRNGPWVTDMITPFSVHVRDLPTGQTFEVVHGEGVNFSPFDTPMLSENGRTLAFRSARRDLTPADMNGFVIDVFLFDFADP